MTNTQITYLVVVLCLVLGLAAFVSLIVVPALSAYRTIWERGAALILSLYVLAALAGIGVLAGVVIIAEWPRLF
ncbi:MAG TPA: hypothetical protein VFN48_02015 [Solirubrobacteraceae bacterium]|nr:hypothetical protein [Solirubrobacteraceae bacterium]